MRRVLGLFGFALALPWVACEDHTVSLSQDQETSLSSAGGTSSDTSSGGSTGFGAATSSNGGSGSSFTAGNTTFGSPTANSTTVSFPFGAGGSNGPTGGANHTDNAGGSGPFGTTGGNEGGRGPDCEDEECLVCAYAMNNCNVPTPDCAEEGWEARCDCSGGCPNGSTCFEGFKCRPPCLGDGTCPDEVFPHCDPEAAACVRCYEDEHCAEFGRVCRYGECVECLTSSDCSGNDYCIAGECVECFSDADCGSGKICDTRNQNCIEIECSNDFDCKDPEQPFCNWVACTECRGEMGCEEGEKCTSFFTCVPE